MLHIAHKIPIYSLYNDLLNDSHAGYLNLRALYECLLLILISFDIIKVLNSLMPKICLFLLL